VALIVLMRVAGKRLAGQTTTFDLIVLITLGVVLQSSALQKGMANALRHLIRGKPRALIRNGEILDEALAAEGISRAELLAGLRKLGHESPETVKLATLEETGHISAGGT
jgi:uncharacterized membrane protein YcaP (DUF421 family)